ncbi:MAG: CDGSH iron-sulfur domain-containing protein, partial [Rikenellaceae bacterium]
LEDPAIGVSSGLWVRGGVRISREDGMSYQIRNRVVLCRCGASNNKPFCDGTHAARGWMDGLDTLPDGAVLPNNE